MRQGSYLFTSESVSEGHPDKVCDRISDSIVDLFLAHDGEARVAAETLTTTNRIVLAGEVRGPDSVTSSLMEQAARNSVRDIGYEQDGFHWRYAAFENFLHTQSPDIAQGVDAAGNKDEGAGDQGIMFGFACRETKALMPAPIHLAHRILQAMADARKNGRQPELGPDAKSQVTLRYEDGEPVAATSIVVSTQHAEGLDQDEVREIVRPYVVDALPKGWMCADEDFYVNPTGRSWSAAPTRCRPHGAQDHRRHLRGASPHGGGAFSGKDPTKVDRSAAYAARYLAKNVVAAELAKRCTIQLSYAIGVSKPLSVYADLGGTGRIGESKLVAALQEVMDLSPRGIRQHLGLNRPIYARTAAYGHFGREPEADGGFSWERTDLVEALNSALT